MKTKKQIELELRFKEALKFKLDNIMLSVKFAVEVSNGYTPLNGTGNTHGDNLAFRAYAFYLIDEVNRTIAMAENCNLLSYDEMWTLKETIHLYVVENNHGSFLHPFGRKKDAEE